MEISYVRTGIDELDCMIGAACREEGGVSHENFSLNQGIPETSTILIRGEPGSGKTTLAMQILNAYLSCSGNKPRQARIISLEENAEELIERMCRNFQFNFKKGSGLLDNLDCISSEKVHDIFRSLNNKKDIFERFHDTGKKISEFSDDSTKIVESLAVSPISAITKLIALSMMIPKKARDIIDEILPEKTNFKGGDNEENNKRDLDPNQSCLLIVDSLNAFLNVAMEYFPDNKHPRTILNTFCRQLRDSFGPFTTILLTGEYHYLEGAPIEAISESFLCDLEIVLRPEPVRVAASQEQIVQAPIGYNHNALIPPNAESIESRPFCRVVKSRGTLNQSRRCTYDIIPQKGIRFYPTYPGDGKLVLFSENQAQFNAWETFFKHDVPDSYPALRTSVFNRMSIQNVFEGQRRLRNMPLKTDMYLSSFDSYWISWYQNFRLKIDIQRNLKEKQISDENKKLKQKETKEKHKQLMNSLMRVLRKCNADENKEISWEDVSDHMSLSYFGETISAYYNDETWEEWIKEQKKKTADKNNKESSPTEQESVGEKKESSFLKVLNDIKKNISHSSFLTRFPADSIKLYGEKRSGLIKSLHSASFMIGGVPQDKPAAEQNVNGSHDYLCVPYDANFGLFVCRRDYLRHAELEQDELESMLRNVIQREKDLFNYAAAQLVYDITVDIFMNQYKSGIKQVSEVESQKTYLKEVMTDWFKSQGTPEDRSSSLLKDFADKIDNTIDEMNSDFDEESKKVQDEMIKKHCFMLHFIMPKAQGRRNYRFRIAPDDPEILKQKTEALKTLVEELRNRNDNKEVDVVEQLKETIEQLLDKTYPSEKKDYRTEDGESRSKKNISLLTRSLSDKNDTITKLISDWFISQLEWVLKKNNKVDRPSLAETLEFTCRAYELFARFNGMNNPDIKNCIEKMIESAAIRLMQKGIPKTWEETIVVSRILNRTVQIDWQTFDSFTCAFLEVLWSCGGSSIVVEEDYQIRITPNTKSSQTGSFETVENMWDAGFYEMLRACHILHELYWQKIAPRASVTTQKSKAFYKGIAGSKDWLFARHWYSTLIELLTAKDEDGKLLYNDEPEMRMELMQIPVSLSAWSEDIASQKENWEILKSCNSNFQCCKDIDSHQNETEAGVPQFGRVSYDPDRKYIKNDCRNPERPKDCPGCPRPLSFSCWGEWSFGLLSGSENTTLATDLVNNMMSSIKVMQRAFTGACVPTVEEFYEMYGDLPCVNLPERDENTLPKTTYNEARNIFFKHAKSRHDIYDYRHCGKIIHSKLEKFRKSTRKMKESEIIRICTEIFSEIQELYSAPILYDE